MRRLSPRDMRRMAQRMGLNITPLEDVERVIIILKDKQLVFENPAVTIMSVKGSEPIYQIIGTPEEQPLEEEPEEVEIPEEDVQLVAAQAGVTPEEAREALKETGGDLAEAIMLLKSRKNV